MDEEKEIGEECEYCGHKGDDVEFQENPFDAEIHNDHTEHWICDQCYGNLLGDI